MSEPGGNRAFTMIFARRRCAASFTIAWSVAFSRRRPSPPLLRAERAPRGNKNATAVIADTVTILQAAPYWRIDTVMSARRAPPAQLRQKWQQKSAGAPIGWLDGFNSSRANRLPRLYRLSEDRGFAPACAAKTRAIHGRVCVLAHALGRAQAVPVRRRTFMGSSRCDLERAAMIGSHAPESIHVARERSEGDVITFGARCDHARLGVCRRGEMP